MQCFKVSLSPLSAFITPMKGDTLFGQLCWAIRNRFGESRLIELLTGYTENRPFAVVSDVFPEGYFPFPCLPNRFFNTSPDGEHYQSPKGNQWLPESVLRDPLQDWMDHVLSSYQLANVVSIKAGVLTQQRTKAFNAIDRRSSSYLDGGFATHSVEQQWFDQGLKWNLYLLLDTNSLDPADCKRCLEDIGLFGYGKDAGSGSGKFALHEFEKYNLPMQTGANASMTLAPSAPQGLGLSPQRSFYRVFTRFGRHGDIAARQGMSPFKNPVLLAQTAAVFDAVPPQAGFVGQGIGGLQSLSNTITATVHQGYAPCLGIRME